MLKHLLLVPLGVLPLACGLSSGDDDDDGAAAGTTSVGVGGSVGVGNGGSNGVAFGGAVGSSSGGGGVTIGNGGNSSAGSGTVSAGEAEDLENKACAGTKIEPENLPAVLQIVLDDSLSMNTVTNATNGQSKWVVTRAALKDTLDALPGNIAIGLLYFPNMSTTRGTSPRDVSACINTGAMIAIDVLGEQNSAHRQRLANSLDTTSPAGATPTHDAYNYGLNNSLLVTKAMGQRYMLLMTDGGPTLSLNCVGEGQLTSPQPQQPIIDAVQAARAEHGIKSFLVGVPGTEDIGDRAGSDGRPWMSKAAVLGGTGQNGCNINGPNWCHIDLTQATDFSAALRRSLGQVTSSIISCDYEIPPEGNNGQPVNLTQINVLYGPGDGSARQTIRRDDSSVCDDGWQLVDDRTVRLCPATCNRLKDDRGAKLELLFGCETEVVPIR
jgi:hypothetical protein